MNSIDPDLTPAMLLKEKMERRKMQEACRHTFGMYNDEREYLVEVKSEKHVDIAEERFGHHAFKYCIHCGIELATVTMPIGDEDE